MKRLPLVPKSEGILLNRNEVMRARKAQQAVHWARKRASPGKLRNPDGDRIVLIEDTSEIHLEKPNLVRFEARQTQPDLPAITTRDSLKASLRHRPDWIILGEIRGGEFLGRNLSFLRTLRGLRPSLRTAPWWRASLPLQLGSPRPVRWVNRETTPHGRVEADPAADAGSGDAGRL